MILPRSAISWVTRVLSLSHGTHEFNVVRHRLIEFLVTEMDFNVIAIEASAANVERLNRYVLYGEGSPSALVNQQIIGFWTVGTQDTLNLVRWLRDHNQRVDPANRVKFYGFDINVPEAGIRYVLDYMRQVGASPSLTENYNCIRQINYTTRSEDEKQRCRQTLQNVYDHLIEHREEYESASSPEAFVRALYMSQIALQAEAWIHSPLDFETESIVRDQFMSENVRWLIEERHPGAKIVLWGHNFHMGRIDTTVQTMGHMLHQWYGTEFVSVGTMTYQGEFTAQHTSRRLQAFPVPPIPEDTHDHYLHELGIPLLFLPMPTDPPEWIASQRLLSIGAVYDTSMAERPFATWNLAEVFDAVIFIDQTTASQIMG
ncbi:MAG TPA: erythromycin esterase family protein [Oceanobacillus sp.]|nr:erythromycin esterase family protein [Oceanobacillus sp.]